MSLALLLGLLFQCAALAWVLLRTRGLWLAHVGVLFVLAAFVYHGAGEVVQAIFPGRNFYRTLVSQSDVDAWVFVAGVGLLLFSITYCLCLRQVKQPAYNPGYLAQWAKRCLPDWRLMFVLAAIGFWINVCGEDYGYWIDSLSSYMIRFAIITFSASLIFRIGSRVLIPVLLLQSVLSLLVDTRSGIVVNAIILLSIMARFRVPIRWKQMTLWGCVSVVLMVLISSARVANGRLSDYAGSADIGARVQWLMGGVRGLTDPAILENAVADDFIYRFDGNAFNGMVYGRLADGCPPAGFHSLWNNFILMVPSFLNPEKLSRNGLSDLFEEEYTAEHYGLRERIDYTVGTVGIIYSYYGSYFLWLMMILLGAAYADR